MDHLQTELGAMSCQEVQVASWEAGVEAKLFWHQKHWPPTSSAQRDELLQIAY